MLGIRALGAQPVPLEEPRSAKAAKWLERAKSPKAKDSLEDRMAAVQEALELHPDDAEAWMMLAEFQFKALRRGHPDLGKCA